MTSTKLQNNLRQGLDWESRFVMSVFTPHASLFSLHLRFYRYTDAFKEMHWLQLFLGLSMLVWEDETPCA